jgi:organic hydroperoxide reductase OsmC/OhrA
LRIRQAAFLLLELRIATESVDAETLDRLVEIADLGCITMNTPRGKLDVRIRTGEARALPA